MEDWFKTFNKCSLIYFCLMHEMVFSKRYSGTEVKDVMVDDLYKTEIDRYCERFIIREGYNCGSLIAYYLYFNEGKPKYKLYENKRNIHLAPFLPKVPIKIILHGFNGSYTTTPNIEIRPEYLLGGYNVISLDYSYRVQLPCYKAAASNVEILGSCFAKFVKFILRNKVKTRIITRYDLHAIGYNLGAQIAAQAGILLRKGCRFGRLTALDPILPLFYGINNHVSQECADFVDVIHTKTKMIGRLQQLGHADFYVNNPLYPNESSIDDPNSYTSLAPCYFSESISKDKYYFGYDIYVKGSQAVMGEVTPPDTHGVFGVLTNKEPPYSHKHRPPDKKLYGVYRIENLRIRGKGTMPMIPGEPHPMGRLIRNLTIKRNFFR